MEVNSANKSSTEPANTHAKQPAGRGRKIAFRLAAVTFGLAPFVLLELFFVLMGWGAPDPRHDPYVTFESQPPLFGLSESGDRYETTPDRQLFFYHDTFAAEKPKDEFRIFCLGGSTVQGRPYAIKSSFTTWLELALRQADPSRQWEVVNCGGVSYASYRLRPIFHEALERQADLIIVYTGHNEFLEERTYQHTQHLPAPLAGPYRRLARLRTVTLLRRGYHRLTGSPAERSDAVRPILPTEVQALLDYRGGLEKYQRNEEWRQGVIDHYRHNLSEMIGAAKDAGVPVVLVNPDCNLRDCPPFKSQHKDSLTPAQLERWRALLEEANEICKTDMRRALELVEQALEIDELHANSHYLRGKMRDVLGMKEEALESYNQARELDVCPLRIVEPMNRILAELARQTGIPLVDTRAMFRRLSPDGIPGEDFFVDHVHPSIQGHQLIANALLDELARLGVVRPTAGWEARRDKAYKDHYASLDIRYFADGIIRLESLRHWAEGRCDFVPPKPKTKPRP